MSNSTLAKRAIISPNHSGLRTKPITRITPHCVVGQLSADRIADSFKDKGRQASCNYVIGKDGEIVLCVAESCRSWCSSSADNDQRAVTIECASETTHPYEMNKCVFESLIELCADICIRNNIHKLIWIPVKEKALNYACKNGEAIITVHRWFANKACPGDWLISRMDELASKVNAKIRKLSSTVYYVQCGAFTSSRNAAKLVNKLKADGFDAYVIEEKYYVVQAGAFCNKDNAIKMISALNQCGYDAIIKGEEL